MTSFLKCVVDTSVCIKQFIPDPLTSKVVALFAHLSYPNTEIFIPDLLYVECANTLWKYVRAGLYNQALAQENLATLKTLPFRVISNADLLEDAMDIAVNHTISAYDASYVALSRQVGASLVTLDKKLVRALASSDFDVRSFNDFDVPSLP